MEILRNNILGLGCSLLLDKSPWVDRAVGVVNAYPLDINLSVG